MKQYKNLEYKKLKFFYEIICNQLQRTAKKGSESLNQQN